jgi:ribonuclease HI
MTDEKLPTVTIYTDGACEPNPGAGGWAALLSWDDGHELELTGFEDDTTNNRMELTAIIEALKSLAEEHTIELYSDSQYCEGLIDGYYHAAANWDLVKKLTNLKRDHKIHFHWIRRDSEPMMIMLDQMAKNAINNPSKVCA